MNLTISITTHRDGWAKGILPKYKHDSWATSVEGKVWYRTFRWLGLYVCLDNEAL